MPGLKDDFQAILNSKKAALDAGIDNHEEMYRKTAEYIYLLSVYNKFEKENLWNQNSALRARNLANWNVGGFSPKQNERIGEIAKEIKRVSQKLGILGVFPNTLYFYVTNPAKRLSDTKLRFLKRSTKTGSVFKVKSNEDRKISVVAGQFGNYSIQDHGLDSELRDLLFGTGADYTNSKSVYESVGFSTARITTMTAYFRFYLMGIEGLSLKEMTKVDPSHPEFLHYVDRYWKYLSDHKITGDNLTAAEKVRNNEAIADIFIKASKKFEEYVFPDIDFDNPEQVKANLRELDILRDTLSDFNQETEYFIKKADSTAVIKHAGGISKWNSLIRTPYEIALKVSFLENIWKTTDEDVINPQDNFFAVSMVLNKTIRKKYLPGLKGKTLKEAAGVPSVKKSVEFKQHSAMAQTFHEDLSRERYPKQEILEELRGNKHTLENRINQELNDSFSDYIKWANRDSAPYLTKGLKESGLLSLPEFNEAVDRVFTEDATGVEIYDRVFGSEENAVLRKNVFSMVRESFLSCWIEDYYQTIGLDRWDVIRIDGISMREKFANKYANVHNNTELDVLLLLELNKELRSGKSLVTMDYYVINQNAEYEKAESVLIARDHNILLREKFFFDEIDALHAKIREDYHTVRTAESEISAGQKAGLTSANLYEKLHTALDQVYKCSDLDSDKRTTNDLLASLKKLLANTEAYYNSIPEEQRQQLKNAPGKTGAVEKVRLNLAEELLRSIPEKITEIDRLSLGINARLNENIKYDADDVNPYTFKRLLKKRDENLKIRGLANAREYQIKRKQTGPDPAPAALPAELDPLAEELDEKFKTGMDANYVAKINALGIKVLQSDHFVKEVENPDDPDHPVKINYKAHDLANLSDRTDTIGAIFLIWVLGNTELRFEEVFRLVEYGQNKNPDGTFVYPKQNEKLNALLQDFYRYCEKHRFTNEDNTQASDDTKLQSGKDWIAVFSGASEKFKAFTLPKIDFSDRNQVAEYSDLLQFCSNMSTNFGQEFPDFLSVPLQNGGTLKKMLFQTDEGRKSYVDPQKDCLYFQSIVISFYHAFVFSLRPAGQEDIYRQKIARIMISRMIMGRYHTQMGGKTIAEIMAHPNKDYFYDANIIGLATQRLALVLSVRQIMEYANGSINPETEKTVLRVYEEVRREFYADFESNVDNDLHNVVYNSELTAEDKQAFRDAPDDAQGMQEFLLHPAGENQTISDLILKIFNTAGQTSLEHAIGQTGIRKSALFVFDNNQTAEDLWGEKYAHIADPWQKEILYCTEIVKKVQRGDSDIRIKSFTADYDGKITLKEEVKLLSPKSEKLAGMRAQFIRLELAVKEAADELGKIQETLASTQDDKNANHFDNEKREGTDLYQNMTVALDKCIQYLSSGENVSFERMLSTVRNLKDQAETYYQARKGLLFGPIRKWGQKRLKESDRLRYRVNNIIERLESIYQPLRQNLEGVVAHNGKTVTSQEFNKLDSETHSYAKRLEEVWDYNDTPALRLLQKENYKDEILLAHAKLQQMQEPASEEERIARQYLLYLGSEVSEGRVFAEKGLYERMIHYKHRIKDLSKNRLFLETIRNNTVDGNITNGAKMWEFTERTDSLVVRKGKSYLNEKVANAGNVARSVANLAAPEAEIGLDASVEEAVNAVRNQMNGENKKEYYTRLTKIVASQILSSDNEYAKDIRAKILMQQYREAGRDYNLYDSAWENYERRLYRYLKQNEYLEGNKLESTLKNLTNGKFANSIIAMDKKRADNEKLYQPEPEINNAWIEDRINDREGQADRFTDREVSMLNKKLYINLSKEYSNTALVFALEFNQTYPHVANNAGFVEARETFYAIFSSWLMGEKNYSFDQMLQTFEALKNHSMNNQTKADLMSEFATFCRNNQVQGSARNYNDSADPQKKARNKENFKNAMANWANCFMKAKNKLKDYTIPDIDYNDKEAIKNHFGPLYIANILGVNITQELDRMLKQSCGGYTAKMALCDKMDQTQFTKEYNQFKAMKDIVNMSTDPYTGTSKANFTNHAMRYLTNDELIIQNMQRVLFANRYNQYRGRKLGDLVDTHEKEVNIASRSAGHTGIMAHFVSNGLVLRVTAGLPRISKADSLRVVYNGPSQQYLTNVESNSNEANFRYSNSLLNSDIDRKSTGLKNSVKNNLDVRLYLNNLKTKEELKAAMDQPVPGKEYTLRDWVHQIMYELEETAYYSRAMNALGYNGSKLFLLKDGNADKTVQELFGPKYENDVDLDDKGKEDMYCLEVLKAISEGTYAVELRGAEITDQLTAVDGNTTSLEIPPLIPRVPVGEIPPAVPKYEDSPMARINEAKLWVGRMKHTEYPAGYANVKLFEKELLNYITRTNTYENFTVLKKITDFEEELATNKYFQNKVKNLSTNPNKEKVIREWIRLEKAEEKLQADLTQKIETRKAEYGYLFRKAAGLPVLGKNQPVPKPEETLLEIKNKLNSINDPEELKTVRIRLEDYITEIAAAQKNEQGRRMRLAIADGESRKSNSGINPEVFQMRLFNADFLRENNFLSLFTNYDPKDKSIPKVLDSFENGRISRVMAERICKNRVYGIDPKKEMNKDHKPENNNLGKFK